MKTRRHFLKKASLGFIGLNTFPFVDHKNSNYPSLKALATLNNDDTLFKLVRESLLIPEDMAYLNTGSLGPSPRQILDEVATAMHELESNPVGNNWGDLGKKMEQVRQKTADFIGADKEEIILTRNTTEGINLVGSCLDLKPGDEILTTDHEHGGGENGLFYLAETKGAVVKKVEMPMPASNAQQIIEIVQKGITNRTKVVMLSHIATITGLRMPFKEIAEITRPRNIILIADGAQAPGQIVVNVKDLGVDVYACSGHKWLLGPKETGFLYLRKDIQEQIQSVFTRGSYNAYSAASGTRNVATIIGLGKTFDFHQTIGRQKIEDRCRSLAEYCEKQLEGMKGLKIISPSAPGLTTGIVSVILGEASNKEVFEKMKHENIIIKLLPKYNALRFSLHMFNTKEEVDRMVTALERMLNG